jgi:hypothetical protein
VTAPFLPPARRSPLRVAGFAALLTGVSLGLALLSAYPWTASAPDRAVVRIAFRHVAPFEETAGREPSREELERLPRHMRPQGAERGRTGTRRNTQVRVALGERILLTKTYRPSGLRHDGPTFGYEEVAVPPGRHRLEARLADAGGNAEEEEAGSGERAGQWRVARDLDIRPGQAVLIEFSEDAGLTIR